MQTSRLIAAIVSVAFVVTMGAGNTAWADEKSDVDAAVDKAAEMVAEDLKATSFEGIKSIAVLPLWGEDGDGYVLDTLKSYLSGSSYALMVRSTPEWEKLLGEIKWNTLREDIMNPQTVQSFGKIEGCDAIVYGTVRERKVDAGRFKAVVRMTLHLANVETGEILWSSKPITAAVWVDWLDMLRLGLRHPVVWMVGGIIVLLIIWGAFKRLVRSATRGR